MNEEWQEDAGRLRILRSASDLEDYAAEVPPNGGTLLVFRRSDRSWHGHKSTSGSRRAIQLNWVTSQAVVDHEQGVIASTRSRNSAICSSPVQQRNANGHRPRCGRGNRGGDSDVENLCRRRYGGDVGGWSLGFAVPAQAESVMKECGTQWKKRPRPTTPPMDKLGRNSSRIARERQASATPTAPAPADAAPAPVAPAPVAPGLSLPSRPVQGRQGEPGRGRRRRIHQRREAKRHCPSDTVVWVNTKSHKYRKATPATAAMGRRSRALTCARRTPRRRTTSLQRARSRNPKSSGRAQGAPASAQKVDQVRNQRRIGGRHRIVS